MLINRRKNSLITSVNENTRSPITASVTTLREKRSKSYMDLVQKIDVGHGSLSKNELDQLIQDLKRQFPVMDSLQLLDGIVAKCYLGDEFEVHTLDLKLDIMQHYKFYEKLSPNLDKARALATSPFYAYIEVYSNCLCAIHTDGSVSIIGSDS